jgi:hypothetical protein
MKWVDLIGKDEDHDRKQEGRGEYDRDHDTKEWWRQPPSWWRGTYPQWQQMPSWQQQQWWQQQYQQQYQQPYYQQPYYQQPVQQTYYQSYYQHPYHASYYTPEQLRERAVHYEQAGYRWVPGYGGTSGRWERPRAPHITIRRTPAYVGAR